MENNDIKFSPRIIIKILVLLIFFVLVVVLVLWFLKNREKLFISNKNKNPEITFVTSLGNIKFELYPDSAPNTVRNIIHLCKNGFYTGKIIYGQDFVGIHVGRNADGTEDKTKLKNLTIPENKKVNPEMEYSIKGEFKDNGIYTNNIKHEKYVLTLARPNFSKILPELKGVSLNSGRSEILILRGNFPNMNGKYAAFGKVIEGMDVVDKIQELELANTKKFKKFLETEKDSEKIKKAKEDYAKSMLDLNAYINPPVIKEVKVDTKGIYYEAPEYIEAFDFNKYVTQKYTKNDQ